MPISLDDAPELRDLLAELATLTGHAVSVLEPLANGAAAV
jgi:hypothetical protein